ncbi:hypothetical protein HO173_000558 [Letharia columbiana]|uniref:Uncharacterized protein n=1 Tax=Letharia columbiana TaxID=112416 RepID=A0A8H6G7C9_9LECA|nr:uncharacterized protein HO173_000558 [Letharia columbiana]KAF6241846.1 hypothetical protein HO173_000558 [Letharia columbiana]
MVSAGHICLRPRELKPMPASVCTFLRTMDQGFNTGAELETLEDNAGVTQRRTELRGRDAIGAGRGGGGKAKRTRRVKLQTVPLVQPITRVRFPKEHPTAQTDVPRHQPVRVRFPKGQSTYLATNQFASGFRKGNRRTSPPTSPHTEDSLSCEASEREHYHTKRMRRMKVPESWLR